MRAATEVRPWLARVAVVVSLMCSGCAANRSFVGRIEHPPELPVRAYAPVAVVHENDVDSIAVATDLVDHLRAGGTAADVASPMSSNRSTVGLVLEVGVRFSSRIDVQWSTRPESYCGVGGCYTRQVSYPYDVPTVVATLGLRVREAASNRLLTERSTSAEAPGADSRERRSMLRGRLVARTVRSFDGREEAVLVRFPRIDEGRFERARELARDGRWDEALVLLEDLARDARYRGMAAADKADVLHAMALCVRFGPEVRRSPVRQLERALTLVDASIALDSSSARLAFRDALRRQMAEATLIEEQRAASPARAVAVPDAYR